VTQDGFTTRPEQRGDVGMVASTPRDSHPAGLVVEDRLGADVVAELRRRGHDITTSGDWSLGRISAAGVEPETGFLRVAAHPRGGQCYAVGR